MNKIVKKSASLKRSRHPMPVFVKEALEERGLMAEYKARPAYQQNDYIGWISNAKLQDTKEKRLFQMLGELEEGGVYMNMSHPPSRKSKKTVLFVAGLANPDFLLEIDAIAVVSGNDD